MRLISKITDSLTALTRDLVRIPSRAGIDPPDSILRAIESWLRDSGVSSEILRDGTGTPVAVYGEIEGRSSRPAYLINATADTAAVGNRDDWHHDPFLAEVEDGWLYGRGSADSKAGVSLFCHLAAELKKEADRHHGTLVFAFDVEEHTGTFLGIRRCTERRLATGPIDGAMIGYPGLERIIVGCRGFYRAVVSVHGSLAHSGSSQHRGVSAVSRATQLIFALERSRLEGPPDQSFPLPPALTVTAIHGGDGFSTVPDVCTLNLDFRLTPTFGAQHARSLIEANVAAIDRDSPLLRPTEIQELDGWPAYRLPPAASVSLALRSAAQQVLGRDLPEEIAGPSSVANYLATMGIGATSGFGVNYRNLHAADECIELASLEPAYQAYLIAIRRLLG